MPWHSSGSDEIDRYQLKVDNCFSGGAAICFLYRLLNTCSVLVMSEIEILAKRLSAALGLNFVSGRLEAFMEGIWTRVGNRRVGVQHIVVFFGGTALGCLI